MKRQKSQNSINKNVKSTSFEEKIDEEKFDNDRKRAKKLVQQRENDDQIIEIKSINHFSDLKDAYDYLHGLCKESDLIKKRSLFPVVWRHQLYSLFSDRASVDLGLEKMVENDKIRILCHGESSRENDAIVLVEDYIEFYKRQKNLLIDLFMSRIVKKSKETEYTDKKLIDNGFSSDAIKKLTSFGILTSNDLATRQLSFAGLGILVRALQEGRDNLIAVIKKCKYSQLLQSELVKRNIKSCQPLGIEFHLYDLYGRNGLVRRQSVNIEHDLMIQLIL